MSTITDRLPESDLDFPDFCRLFFDHTGFELSAYKRNQVERRTRAFAQRKGACSLYNFWLLLATDPQATQQYLDYLTINVTEFFRDADRFREMTGAAIAGLLRTKHAVRIWSAGCATGAEAYSLKMLLRQEYPALTCRILATDIDRKSLEKARAGLFSEQEIATVPQLYRDAYFMQEGTCYRIDDALRDGIEFQRHDLLRDPYPTGIDLILCRNVIIYFAQEAKTRICSGFSQALAPEGYLFVGSTERIIEAQAIDLTPVHPHLYRKSSPGR